MTLEGLLIGSTIAGFKCDDRKTELNWLQHAAAWKERGARFACAIQTGQGHDDAILPLGLALRALEATVWTFSVDQGESEVTSDNRLINICTGRNLIQEIAQRDTSVKAILFLDTDILCPEDLPERLLEVHHPMVGANCPQYCLDGPSIFYGTWFPPHGYWVKRDVEDQEFDPMSDEWVYEGEGGPFPYGADVREHWNTAGCLLVRRPIFRRVAWSWDAESGTTDDPHYQNRAKARTWVRHDVEVLHEPLVPLEQRNHDRRVIR